MSNQKSSSRTLLVSVLMSAPQAQFSYYLDKVGSAVVAVYLVLCGIQTIAEKVKVKDL